MAPRRSSLLRSVADLLHISRSTGFTFASGRRGSFSQGPLLKPFEDDLAAGLQSLLRVEVTRILSLEWLKDAVWLLTATNLGVQTFIPEIEFPLSERDEKWIKNYLDCSRLARHIFILFIKDIAGIQFFLMYVQDFVSMLHSQSSLDADELINAKDLLAECMTLLKKHVRAEKNQTKDQHLLEDLAKMFLCKKALHQLKKSRYGKVFYAAQLTTITVCSIMVSAFSGHHIFVVKLSSPEAFAWAHPFLSLQKSINAAITERIEQGLNFLIPELSNVEFCLTKLKSVLDHYGNPGVLTNLTESRERLTGDLKKETEVANNTLESLKNETQMLFHLTMKTDGKLLDKFMD